MTRRSALLWSGLAVFLVACTLGCLFGWAVLLTSFCSAPRVPGPARAIAYSCHGMTVFITPLESWLREWLLPMGFTFLVPGLFAAIKAAMAAGMLRIDLSVKIVDKPDREPRS